MTTLASTFRDLNNTLASLLRQHRVPGASLAIGQGREIVEAAAGVTSLRTRVDVNTDTLFQIGSITKVYTTTLVMQLVDEGAVDIDAPVRTYLPEFELAVSADDTDRITVRHLISHASGMQGDYFEDFGDGADSIERYVESMRKLDLVHPTGAMFSYCNSGFVLAGRVIEKVTGKTYRAALDEHLLKPAGLRDTTINPAAMLGYRYAVGHIRPSPDVDVMVAPNVLMGMSSAPAGSVTSATARDVVRFAKIHLNGGRTNSRRVLSRASTTAMQTPEVKRPPLSLADSFTGLGWGIADYEGTRVIAHNGGTIGQLAFLVAVPEHDLSACLLTNGASGGELWQDISAYVLDEAAGIRLAPVPDVPDEPAALDLDRYAGRYERLSLTIETTVGDDGVLLCKAQRHADVLGPGSTTDFELVPLDDVRFVARGAVSGIGAFVEPDAEGQPQYLHLGGRAARRVS